MSCFSIKVVVSETERHTATFFYCRRLNAIQQILGVLAVVKRRLGVDQPL